MQKSIPNKNFKTINSKSCVNRKSVARSDGNCLACGVFSIGGDIDACRICEKQAYNNPDIAICPL
jgi:hypothetical protein